MSLRDIHTPNDDKLVILNAEPMGNGGGLGDFHTVSPEDREPNNTPKILGGLVVALMLGAAGAYVYSVSGHQPKQIVAANSLPAPSAPAPAAAPAPMPAPDNNQAANTPAPQAAPATDTKPAPVRSAAVTRTRAASAPDMGAAQARMSADSTPAVQPQQQAVVTPVEPVSPQPPASALANNNVQQPATEVAPPATPQADAAPAQDQQPAAPAAQPAPQQ